ncbi:MAG: OmpA family protein [Acidobacteria bacterium]|nr:OmpA family protein [Acidobacteriota bacterium]
MSKQSRISSLILSGLLCITPLAAQAPAQDMRTTEPVNAVKALRATRSTMGISYPEGPTITVDLQGTQRDPEARGKAKVERKRGETDVKVKIDHIKPATYFGGDLATYVLWIVSPEGHIDNAGEFIVRGDEIKLDVSTPLQTFGMFVTAEPHFLVSTPSEYVVLENSKPRNDLTGQMMKGSTIKYRGMDGIYSANRQTLVGVERQKQEVRTDMKQARMAVDLAERAGAAEYSPDKLAEAKSKLNDLINAVEAKTGDTIVMSMGHEIVRIAVDAQKEAEEKAFQAALDAERSEHRTEIMSLQSSIDAANDEAEKARLLAEQREMKIQMEQRARQSAMAEAQEAAAKAAEEARKRELAEQRAMAAAQEADRMASARNQAELEAQRARAEADRANAEREAARNQMRQALSMVVETRETARGLILNLPDILFDFDKATLRPEARETLSRVCGVLSVARGYDLSVEGHTDSVGSDAYNQTLSEKRAQSVQTYFNACQLPSVKVTAQGFGESKPIASNDSADGRQKNRRVEIVIQESDDFEMSKLQQ